MTLRPLSHARPRHRLLTLTLGVGLALTAAGCEPPAPSGAANPPQASPAEVAPEESPALDDGVPETPDDGSLDDDPRLEPLDTTPPEVTDDDRPVVLFTLNVHDWVFSDRSVETIHRVIDIHEAKGVPVDIYLTDPILQAYLDEAPELIERLKTSPMVAVSYHVRPPAPYYPGYDHYGLDLLSDLELGSLLETYETHALDLETGLADTSRPGGYALLAEEMGYSPLAVGMNSGHGRTTETLSAVYADYGATFMVVHGKDSELGDQRNGLWVRPEHVEIKLYEYKKEDPADILEAEIEEKTCAPDCVGRVYVNVKFHENNFYTTNTPWWPVYFTDKDKSEPLAAPYDLEASDGVIHFKPPAVQDEKWALWEGAVQHVAAHPERYQAINLIELRGWLPAD